ncbi:MAG: NAD(+)/NADH kinase [Lachnospiraceae bacterium]|nr:NAD(+)/NADH kinase [Lachnospiraceae bacterium]MBQ9136926.1 NAD(+)/NADH kinase [Lachnospiraceae bacterium]
MKNFCVYTNTHKDKNLEMTNRVCRFLGEKGMQYCVRAKETGEPLPDVDCILVLGGDGTMLKAAREMESRKRVPLLGINLGTLGYLTEVEPDNVEAALTQLLEGDYELESRMMLNGTIYHKDGTKQEEWALNDIVIGRSGIQQVMNFNVYVNRKLLHKYLADGIIVTTPTGSTGYNLSAGGPIVEPGARLLVLTPICPHTMNQRSVVLSSEDEVVIEVPAGREGKKQCAAVNFDGYAVELQTGDAVRIVRSERTTEFVKLSKAGFLEILHKKMSDT